MNDNDQTTKPNGRSIAVKVFGNTADELEFAAIDEARKFFGDRRLEVVNDYHVYQVISGSREESQGGGKAYYATVTVRTVE